MIEWFTNLVCPRDHQDLEFKENLLLCPNHHEYPVVDGVPIMLLKDVQQTLAVGTASLEAAGREVRPDPFYIESLGCSEEERHEIRKLLAKGDSSTIDPVVQYLVAATNGHLYKHLLGKLHSLPIPELRLPPGEGKPFLELGCNWGRWCIAAAHKGYEVVGIDASLGAVMAARRVGARLGIRARYIVGDARYLPFRQGSFSTVFSYSVLQHFSKSDAVTALHEMARVLEDGGVSLIQMPNALGVRSLQHQFKRGFRGPKDFEVRYWTPSELVKTFRRVVGRTDLSVDGFFGLGIQASDLQYMPAKYRAVIKTSELLRGISRKLPGLRWIADSLYLRSIRKARCE